MSATLLSTSIADGAPQKTTTAPISTQSTMFTNENKRPTEQNFKELVNAYSNLHFNSNEIQFTMLFTSDLGYDSLQFELLLISIEDEFAFNFMGHPLDSEIAFSQLTVGDLWLFVLSEWDGLYGRE